MRAAAHAMGPCLVEYHNDFNNETSSVPLIEDDSVYLIKIFRHIQESLVHSISSFESHPNKNPKQTEKWEPQKRQALSLDEIRPRILCF